MPTEDSVMHPIVLPAPPGEAWKPLGAPAAVALVEHADPRLTARAGTVAVS